MPKKGYKQTEEHIRNHALAIMGKNKGRAPWNKGLTKETHPSLAILSVKYKGRKAWNEGLTKETHSSVARQGVFPRTEYHKEISKRNLPKASDLKGREIIWGNKISLALKGRKQPPDLVEKNKQSHLLYWQNATLEWKEKWLRSVLISANIKPNKQELKLLGILDEYCPNKWIYSGDGKVKEAIVGSKCPDFWNGDHKFIEFFGDFWHSEEVTGRTKEEEENEKTRFFAKYGYDILIIWEHELKNQAELVLKIKEFSKDIIKSGK